MKAENIRYGFLNGVPINVGEGYELVPAAETEKNDMDFFWNGEWHPNALNHSRIVSCGFYARAFPAFRRKIPALLEARQKGEK